MYLGTKVREIVSPFSSCPLPERHPFSTMRTFCPL
nr:MAG TPA: hypothetical protein [Caudoviricetes sp.]